VSIAGVAGQTALSGSQIKPPALPEVPDSASSERQPVSYFLLPGV